MVGGMTTTQTPQRRTPAEKPAVQATRRLAGGLQ